MAFWNMDWTWVATAAFGPQGVIPIYGGQWLAGRTNREAELAPFKPQELIPTVGCARDRDRGTHLLDFTALSVNV